MEKNPEPHNPKIYQDVSRITLKGLADITSDFQEFYQQLTVRFQPTLEGMAQEELPEASDQLSAIIEATESAATGIMDELESMQVEYGEVASELSQLMDTDLPSEHRATLQLALDKFSVGQGRIMTIFEQLSFQDLTGQRIKQIVKLVQSVEGKVQVMLGALGDQVQPKQSASEKGDSEKGMLQGPRRPGEAMDQSTIDALLADL